MARKIHGREAPLNLNDFAEMSPLDERRATFYARTIGMPDGAAPMVIQEQGETFGKAWTGYQFTLLGSEAPDDALPQIGPTWTMRSGGEQFVVLQLWSQIVTLNGCQLWGEALWRPGQPLRMHIHGLERPHSQQDVLKIDAGLNFIAGQTRGRKIGSGIFATREEFVRSIADLSVKLWRRQKPKRVTAMQLVDKMGCQHSEFYRFCDEFTPKVDWRAERDKAIAEWTHSQDKNGHFREQ